MMVGGMVGEGVGIGGGGHIGANSSISAPLFDTGRNSQKSVCYILHNMTLELTFEIVFLRSDFFEIFF